MNWIKVENKLPYENGNDSVYVLVYNTKYDSIEVRPYNEHHKCWDTEDGDDYFCDAVGSHITHWMPLPDAPEEQSKQIV